MEYKKVYSFLIIITILAILCPVPPLQITTAWSLQQVFQYKLSQLINLFKLKPSGVKLNISREKHYKGNNKLKTKYILQWTDPSVGPVVYLDELSNVFIEEGCFVNCLVTNDRTYLEDYTDFDVIAFAGERIKKLRPNSLPERRKPHQKFVFATLESADNYPVCSNKYDDFFNWTWTYKLNSDLRWGYIIVRDKNKTVIGPNEAMHWIRIEDMDPVSPELSAELKTKTKAAAWFVSHCGTRNERENYILALQKELIRYDLDVDIYGRCGRMKCPEKNEEMCNEMIKKDYYFYLSFENSFSEDYVTEKLLRALNFNAIPIVYGGANYTRFMPDGIYLDARKIDPTEMASKMYELIQDPEQYIQYFKWRNHYTYHKMLNNFLTDQYCMFCKWLNDEEMVKKTSTYEHFRDWWNAPNRC